MANCQRDRIGQPEKFQTSPPGPGPPRQPQQPECHGHLHPGRDGLLDPAWAWQAGRTSSGLVRSPGRALATEVESQVPVPGVCTMMPGPRDGHWHATSVARGLTVTLRGFATTEKEPLGWPRAGHIRTLRRCCRVPRVPAHWHWQVTVFSHGPCPGVRQCGGFKFIMTLIELSCCDPGSAVAARISGNASGARTWKRAINLKAQV